MAVRLRNRLTASFRASARINRDVLRAYLRDVHGTVVELGPGTSPLLRDLDHIPDEQKVVVEFEGVISTCRDLGYRCLAQDLGRDRWDLPDDSVDCVVSSQVLEHIPGTDHVIHESWRVLKPGGRFLVSVPNPGALAYIAMLLLTVNPPMSMVSDEWTGLGNPFSSRRRERATEYGTAGHGHLRLFTVRGMKDLLEVNGFRVLACHGATWGVPLIGRLLARVFPWYGLMTIVLAEKPRERAAP